MSELRTKVSGGPGGHDEWLASWFQRPDPLLTMRGEREAAALLAQCPSAEETEPDAHLRDLGVGAGQVMGLEICASCYTKLGLNVIRAAGWRPARVGVCDVCGGQRKHRG